MKLSAFKNTLSEAKLLAFELPDGKTIPAHFHVTEIGEVERRFIDCGGKVRRERAVNFQLWEAEDFDHRLSTEKLLEIIRLSEDRLALEDAEVEVEYQSETIGRYGLAWTGAAFRLTVKQTDCLASDKCGIPVSKQKLPLNSLTPDSGSCCTPGGNCC